MTETAQVPVDLLKRVLQTALSDNHIVEGEFSLLAESAKAYHKEREQIRELARIAGIGELST